MSPHRDPVVDPKSNSTPLILVVDDDPGQRSLLVTFLGSQGFRTIAATSGEEALEVLKSREVSMMISDVRMPGLSGLETLRFARQEHPVLPVLMVTAYADIRDAVGAMRDGAVNYLSKPIDLDELAASVRQATGVKAAVTPLLNAGLKLPEGVICESPITQAVFRDASLVADSDSRILISGESGVGKEVLVDVIHHWSRRSKGPLIKVNCAAIPENLLESELFGHQKGAFTGAIAQRIGRFEHADGGTIFLDEIGEMSPSLQAKILRVTQDGRIQRVGSNNEIQVNARIIAATNRNLEVEVEKGKFREDLFYRLNVVELNLPPLRERIEDIIPLATRFMSEFSKGNVRFSAPVAQCLKVYPWPGNVRELRNAMERAALLVRGEMLMLEHLPNRVRSVVPNIDSSATASDPMQLEVLERQAICEALKKHQFNRTETAKALGISRRTLVYKVQKLRDDGYPVDPPSDSSS